MGVIRTTYDAWDDPPNRPRFTPEMVTDRLWREEFALGGDEMECSWEEILTNFQICFSFFLFSLPLFCGWPNKNSPKHSQSKTEGLNPKAKEF